MASFRPEGEQISTSESRAPNRAMLVFSPGSKGLLMAAWNDELSLAEKTWTLSPEQMSSRVEEGDHRRCPTGPVVGGSLMACRVCSVSTDRTVMVRPLSMAMSRPSGLALHDGDAIKVWVS